AGTVPAAVGGGWRQSPAACCKKLPASSYAFSSASTRIRRSVLSGQAASRNACRSGPDALASASTNIPSIDRGSTFMESDGATSGAGLTGDWPESDMGRSWVITTGGFLILHATSACRALQGIL